MERAEQRWKRRGIDSPRKTYIPGAGHAVSDEILSCLRQERAKLENPVQNVVTVTAQEPAYLHCRIPQRTNHMVAWTRASDQALLTAGHHSFTSDPRFQVSKKSDTDWILILRRADMSDRGCYLCEVNTEPSSTIYAVFLDVQEPAPPPPTTHSECFFKAFLRKFCPFFHS
nr:Hypothetical protein CBG24158 [Haemonchus contortus]